MQYVQDSFDTGTVVAACLSPGTLEDMDPMLRCLLKGQQLFVKLRDGSYQPKGCEFGLPHGFLFSQLCDPAVRPLRS